MLEAGHNPGGKEKNMTVKEYNALRHSIFCAAMEAPEIEDAVNNSGVAYIYDVWQGENHTVLVLTAKTQLNSNTLIENGFDPELTDTRLVLKLNRQTKCVYFGNEV